MRLTRLVLALVISIFTSSSAFAQVGLPGQNCLSEDSGVNCPAAIPDPGSVTSYFDLFGCAEGQTITDIDVGLEIDHTWVGDLVIRLTSPDDTLVTIYDRPGVPPGLSVNGCGGEDIRVILDDEGTEPVEDYCDTEPGSIGITGVLIPNEPLSAIHGETGAGTWYLQVNDVAGLDEGTLINWSVGLICGTGGGGAEPETRATFTVEKSFTDGNPGEVDVALSCNTGLPLQQNATITEGESVTFVVTKFAPGEMDCSVTETPVEGYSATYSADGGQSYAEEGCTFEAVQDGGALTCEVRNEPEPVLIEFYKTWVYENVSAENGVDDWYRLDVYCSDAEITLISGNSSDQSLYNDPVEDDASAWFEAAGEGYFNVYVRPLNYASGAACAISETVYDSAVESENDCGEFTVSVGTGYSCGFVNTVFFEGIPTLSRYGLALMALLMLGVGLVAHRRIV